MKNFDLVAVSIDGKSTCYTGLDHDIRRAIDEYIDRQHAYALELFHQGKVSDARSLMQKLSVLMTFKVNYMEEN